ncbi:MAG TPA: NAD(P)/FAD-dependent oxidoreductase [Spirochaetota bacterium]|nr:NAD(P)/FAD-dependent oxidoreductase [Spirochaetota bacterium]
MKRIAVIGGGASGLIAACFAAERGSVVVFEKQKKIGRKILVSGNGRCNLSNRFIDAARYHGKNPKFVNNVFARFGPDDTLAFFLSISIPVVELERGRLYPASLQSSSVVKVFEYELARRGVDVRLHRKIESIRRGNDGFRLTTAGKETHDFDAVILAAGSCAYAPAGASSIGYELAASTGHTVREPFPAILPINIPNKALHRLEGIKWDVGAALEANGRTVARSAGELLFTKYGISGPAALDISRAANENVLARRSPVITIDLFPERSRDELRATLESLWSDANKPIAFSLAGILKERMPEVLCELAGIDPETRIAHAGAAERDRLIATMKDLRLQPGEPRPFAEAVVAAGGVPVDEIDPATMESRIAKGLYITGELLDIDGDTGGFNLQFAWSTGAIAGTAV